MPCDVGLLGADVGEDRLALVPAGSLSSTVARVGADRHVLGADRELDARLLEVVERVDLRPSAGTARTSWLPAKTIGFSTSPSS